MRTHVVLPEEMIAEIDRIAGKRGRSHFIEEALRTRLRHEKQMRMLKEIAANPIPLGNPDWDTPEKTSQWVHDLRQRESDLLDKEIERWHSLFEDSAESGTS